MPSSTRWSTITKTQENNLPTGSQSNPWQSDHLYFTNPDYNQWRFYSDMVIIPTHNSNLRIRCFQSSLIIEGTTSNIEENIPLPLDYKVNLFDNQPITIKCFNGQQSGVGHWYLTVYNPNEGWDNTDFDFNSTTAVTLTLPNDNTEQDDIVGIKIPALAEGTNIHLYLMNITAIPGTTAPSINQPYYGQMNPQYSIETSTTDEIDMSGTNITGVIHATEVDGMFMGILSLTTSAIIPANTQVIISTVRDHGRQFREAIPVLLYNNNNTETRIVFMVSIDDNLVIQWSNPIDTATNTTWNGGFIVPEI